MSRCKFAFFNAFLLAFLALPAYSQGPLICPVSATPVIVRSEGLAEKMGDIVLKCTGGTPGLVITGNLSISLSVPITNHLAPGATGDILVTVDTGLGPIQQSVNEELQTPQGQVVSLNGLTFTTPSSGNVTIRIDNLRGAANRTFAGQEVVASLALNNLSTMTLINNSVVVARPQPGLLANSSSTTIRCVGSPLPTTINLANLFATATYFESTRLTEGFPSAFQPRGSILESAGTRFLVKYTGIPAGIMLFVPDFIAGDDAQQPTSGGDLGRPQAIGSYIPGSGTLVLARVVGADSNGNGGLPLSGTFGSATQLPITAGSTYVVYEVLDANDTKIESAQFPTFVGTAATGVTPGTANVAISFAPLSTDATASSAPIPRFVAAQPPSDCLALNDCGASYFPAMQVFAQSIIFTAIQGGLALQPPGYIAVQNPNRDFSVLNWVASVKYVNGADWLTIEQPFGQNNGSVRVFAQPQKLAPGTYNAFVIIDGGVAGTQSVPVTLIVSALTSPPPVTTPPPTAPPSNNPAVTSVTNGANYLPGAVVAGSIASIRGSKFSGKSVGVTFDGTDARILSSTDTQLNVLVPDGMSGRSSAQVVVTVDGLSSTAMTVPIAFAAPAICENCILNPDFSVNNATSAAPTAGSVHIFLTGLPASAGTILVKIHDRDDLTPTLSGAANGLPGLQFVDVTVPADLPSMTTTALVCVVDASGVKTCGAPAPITLTATQQ
jgi:uncharacterized protein (TIGR03437 family)